MEDPNTPATAQAPADYPVQIDIAYPEKQSRLLALFSLPFFLIRFILLIPPFVILYVLSIAALVAAWLGMWGVLFTGHYPKGLHSFVSGFLRWNTRVSAYTYGLTDKYPPFRLKP